MGLNPLDLHALGAPLAFTLSQDQTLRKDSSDIILANNTVINLERDLWLTIKSDR